MIRAEVVDYDTLQARSSAHVRSRARGDVASSTSARDRLDLAGGARARPDAQLVLVDENPGMLEVARDALPAGNVEGVRRRRPRRRRSPTDRSTSSCRRSPVHHLDGRAEAGAVREHSTSRLTAGGRFVLADVVDAASTRPTQCTPLAAGLRPRPTAQPTCSPGSATPGCPTPRSLWAQPRHSRSSSPTG